MGRAALSCSSSIDSSNHPPSSSTDPTTTTTNTTTTYNISVRRDLSTDLRLGLSISNASHNHSSSTTTSTQSELKRFDWPPIKPLLRNTLAGKADNVQRHASLYVKVYMEGIPIGRKLDLFAHHDYNALIRTLAYMFSTTIHCPEDVRRFQCEKYNVLTYEDKEGDWMMVGDVPWEMFLTTVKRLKITRADRC